MASKANQKREVEDAVFHLRLIEHGTHLVDLYQKLFLDDFRDRGIDYGSAKTLLAAYDRLCELVNARMFPCYLYSDTYWYEESIYTEIEHTLATVPICFMSRSWFDKADGLTPLEKLVLSATRTADDFGLDLPKIPAGHMFSESKLQSLCEESREPKIRLLPRVVLGITCSTMNIWVDLSDDEFYQAESPDWNEQSIRSLAEEFAEAKKIWRLVEEFENWVNKKPARLKQVERLLRESIRPKNERVRVANRPLVETLEAII